MEIDDLDQAAATAAINSLREGVPSASHAALLTVGQAGWLGNLRENLGGYITDGGAMVRIVKGEYGDGKTHLLQVLGSVALQSGYAVSHVDLGEARLNHFEEVYSALVRHIQTPEHGERAIKHLLENWFESKYRAALDTHPEENPSSAVAADLSELMSEAEQLSGDFRSFVRGFANNMLKQPEGWEEVNELLLRWAEGEAVVLRQLRTIGIFSRIDRHVSKEAFRSVTRLVQLMGLKGLIVLLDEVEQVLNQTLRVRTAAYQNIRELVDSADGGGGILAPRGCLLLFTATPELFISEKGFVEYKALWDRIRGTSATVGWVNYRAPIIDLTLTPLNESDLADLARRIRRVHGIAHGWHPESRLTDAILEEYVRNIVARFGAADVRPPRILVRTIVDLLDRVQLDPEFSPKDAIDRVLADEYEAASAEKREVVWTE